MHRAFSCTTMPPPRTVLNRMRPLSAHPPAAVPLCPRRYRIQSRYVLKKPLVVTPMSLPTDVYKFRYEIDLNPTYIYRLTPVFGKNVDKPKIVKGSWDEVNSLPLEKLNDTLIDAIKLAEDIFKFDPKNKRPSNHTWAEPGGKERSVKEWALPPSPFPLRTHPHAPILRSARTRSAFPRNLY